MIAIPHDDPIQCTAYQIAMGAVPEMKEKPVICVKMPMTKDPDILEQAHKDGTEILIRELEKGYDVALLTLGDTTVYASSMYLVQRLEKQGYETKLISGIPSFCAAAAELGISLGEQAEEIHILPGSYGIQAALALSGVKVIMKSGKAYPKVVEQLQGKSFSGLYGGKLYHGGPEAVSWGETFSRKGRILYFDDCKRFSKGGRGQMINFVGAGSGAADLITVRGAKLLGEADVIIYAGSLVNPELLSYAKRDCQIYNSAHMTLEEVIDVMKEAEKDGQMTVRLHTGDPSLYGAIREQMDQLNELGIRYTVCPGVSSFCGAAAALGMEYTLPDITQSVVITRMAGRTPVPERESIASFASHGATMVVFLSTGMLKKLSEELMKGGYQADTPAAIVYKATWPDEKVVRCTVATLAASAEREQITKTALIIVGDAVAQTGYERSKLYDPGFTTEFRQASVKEEK